MSKCEERTTAPCLQSLQSTSQFMITTFHAWNYLNLIVILQGAQCDGCFASRKVKFTSLVPIKECHPTDKAPEGQVIWFFLMLSQFLLNHDHRLRSSVLQITLKRLKKCSQMALLIIRWYVQFSIGFHFIHNLQVIEVPTVTLDIAWQVFEELEGLADNCSIMLAKNLNRNASSTGFKKQIFRPLRHWISHVITTHVLLKLIICNPGNCMGLMSIPWPNCFRHENSCYNVFCRSSLLAMKCS